MLLSSGLLAVIPVKCNSIFDKRSPQKVDDGYEYVMLSGSNIPQRVPKGSVPVSASPVEVYGGSVMRDLAQKNQHLGKLPAAGN